MTNELEKQFFQCFEIEPINYIKDFPTREKAAAFGRKITGIPKHSKGKFEIGSYTNNIDIFQVHWKEYPQITDRILLELICIRCKELISIIKVKGNNLEELKNYILKLCIKDYTFYSKTSDKTYNELADNFKHQVQALFKEEK